MVSLKRNSAVVRMYMNHSLSGIEDGISELDSDFRAWSEHPWQRGAWTRVAEHLVSLRWLLEQHFSKLAGEGMLETVACCRPSLYPELRSIETGQEQAIDDLDAIIQRVEALDLHPAEIESLVTDFKRLKYQILEIESMELAFLEQAN